MSWIDGFASELELEHLSKHETEHLLQVARDVAHRVERKTTPLAMYLIGLSVGLQAASGRPRDDAIDDAVHSLILRLPPAPDQE